MRSSIFSFRGPIWRPLIHQRTYAHFDTNILYKNLALIHRSNENKESLKVGAADAKAASRSKGGGPPTPSSEVHTTEAPPPMSQLTTPQIEAILQTFDACLSKKVDDTSRDAVSKANYERNIYLHRIQLTDLKNEIHNLQKQESLNVLNALESLFSVLLTQKLKLREILSNLKASLRLDLSLEKSGLRDNLLSRQLKLMDISNQINAERSQGFTLAEKSRNEILYFLTSMCFSILALILGYLRYIA